MESIIQTASSYAADIDFAIIIVAILAGFWFLLAQGALFGFIFKFTRKNNPKAAYITGEKKEEMRWIHWPHNLIILCDIVIIFYAVKVWYNVKQVMPPTDSTIKIIGQQWAWKFVHPGKDNVLGTEDDIKTVDDLTIEVNKTYRYELEADDVMHSFSVPVFRLKQDAIPGRRISGWFKPTKVGDFDIQCAEMCGVGHGIMGARLHVKSAEDHAQWLKSKSKKLNAQKKNENTGAI